MRYLKTCLLVFIVGIFLYPTLSYTANAVSTRVDFGSEGIIAIPEGKCYVLGSAEANTTSVQRTISYSHDNQVSWGYTPVDNGDGLDCSVTHIQLAYNDFIHTISEDLEAEFVGTFTDTTTIPDGNGMVELDGVVHGTYAFGSGMFGIFNDGKDVITDADGNVYFAGVFEGSVDFDPTAGTDVHTAPSGAVFVTKLNADGSYGHTYTFGSIYTISANIALDADDNLYVFGDFRGTVDFDPTIGVDMHASEGGGQDIFLTKVNEDGTYGYTYTIGERSQELGAQSEEAGGIAITDSGDVYITGIFRYVVDFDPTAGEDLHTSSRFGSFGSFFPDVFLTKINADGSYGYTHTFGGYDRDQGYGIALDSDENIYITGYFEDTADFDPTAGEDFHTSNGGRDIFITKIYANGSYAYTQSLGGSGYDTASNIEIDGDNNVYVVGSFSDSVDFDYAAGTDIHTSNGGFDIFFTKIESDGTYGYTYTAGGIGEDIGKHIAIDFFGAVYITGGFTEVVDFDYTANTDNHTSNGGSDFFLTKVNADGSYEYTRTFGGAAGDRCGAGYPDHHGCYIAVNTLGHVYIVGRFSDTIDFNPGSGVDNVTSSVFASAFITKMNTNGTYGSFFTDYQPSGSYETTFTAAQIPLAWSSLEFTQDVPTYTTLTHEVFDSTCTTSLIAPTTDSTIDISGLSVADSTYCIRSSFSTTEVNSSPEIDVWEATYTTDGTPAEFGYFEVDEYSEPIIPTPEITSIDGITDNSLKLHIYIDDINYANTELTFRIKQDNRDENVISYENFTKTTNSQGKVSISIQDLDEDTEYAFKVKFKEVDIYSEYSNEKKEKTLKEIEDKDNTPKDLVATLTSSHAASITWEDESDDESGYLLERKKDYAEFRQIASLPKNTEKYIDANLEDDTTYTYRVRAFKGNDYTNYSNEDSVTVSQNPDGNETDPDPQGAICGNAILEQNEQCDDGNTDAYDGCDSLCQREGDDNDGIPTKDEDPNGNGDPSDDDTDNDGIPDYRDPDDDNDGIPTNEEDVNNNGNLGDDDENRDGIPAYRDPNEPEVQGVAAFLQPESKIQKNITKNSTVIHVLIAMGLVTGTAAATSSTSIPLVSAIPRVFRASFRHRFFSPFGMVFKPRDGRNWGLVFDAYTKVPVANAVVSLINSKGRVVETAVTDEQGRYGFLAREGIYAMKVTKGKYTIQKKYSVDSLYGSLYTGDTITVTDETVALNIALDPGSFNWSVFAERLLKRYVSIFSIVKRDFFFIVYVVGFVFTSGVAIIFPSILNSIILVLYIGIFIYSVFWKKKSYGVLHNEKSKTPIPFVTLSLFREKDPEKRVAFSVTDTLGRYFILGENGRYILKIQGRTLEGNVISKSMKVVLKKGVLKEKISV